MKKLLLAVGISLGLTANTHAFVIDTEACAGTEYIYDQQGVLVEYDPAVHTFVTAETPVFYGAYEKVTYLTLSNNRTASIRVKNISDASVNFFFRPTYFVESNGTQSNISPESFYGVFDNSNNPLNGAGANMLPKTFGRIYLSTNNNNVYDGYASIYWDSGSCMSEPPLLATSETYFSLGSGSNTRAGISVQLVNQGKPW